MPGDSFNVFDFLRDLKRDLREDIENMKRDIKEDMEEMRQGREKILERLSDLERTQHESKGTRRFVAQITHVAAIVFGGLIGTLVSWLRH